MRIGIFIPEFPGQTHIFFWREICALQELGFEIQILSSTCPTPGSCTHDFASAEHGTQYCWPPSVLAIVRTLCRWPAGAVNAIRYAGRLKHSGSLVRRLGLWTASLVLVDIARRYKLQFIYGHSCADAAHLLAMAHRVSKMPFGLCLHGDLEAYGADHKAKFERASFVLAASKRHLETARESGVLSNVPHAALTMGVDLSKVIRQSETNTGQLKLITVARLNRAKGHEFALRAVRACLDQGVPVSYSIIGVGDYEGRIAEVITELKLEGVVRLWGSLNSDAVAQALASHQVFLLPSVGIGEAAPVAVMEAMAAGVPVIASRIGDTEDMITDGVDGYLTEQQDWAAMARAITRLARDPNLRAQLGERARQRAREQFDCRGKAEVLATWLRRHDLPEEATA